MVALKQEPPKDPRFSLVGLTQEELRVIRVALYALSVPGVGAHTIAEQNQASRLYNEIANA